MKSFLMFNIYFFQNLKKYQKRKNYLKKKKTKEKKRRKTLLTNKNICKQFCYSLNNDFFFHKKVISLHLLKKNYHYFTKIE